MKFNLKNKNFIVSLLIIILAFVSIFGYKFFVDSNAILGVKEYKVIVTNTSATFKNEYNFKTKETSLGKDLDERGFIETKKGAYGRFVTGVKGKKADESKRVLFYKERGYAYLNA